MLNEEHVKLMAKMTLYENKKGQKDLKICSYFKKDYISFSTWVTAVWITLGYFFLITLWALGNLESLIESLTLKGMIIYGGIIIVGYIVMLITYIIIANVFYTKKYNIAKNHVKKYYRNLSYLTKKYTKEGQDE